MKTRAGRIASLVAFLPALAAAQSTMYTDQFLQASEPGAIGLVVDNVATLAKARKVTLLEPQSAVRAPRRARCIVAIAHRDPDQAGRQTYVGVQIVKFFTTHDSPDLLHVGRNEGWTSVVGNRPLPKMAPVELMQTSIAQFAALHGDAADTGPPPLMLGTRRSVEWHATAAADDAESYSATEAHRRFWARNPLEIPEVAKLHLAGAGAGAAVRVENRLVRFQLTDSRSVAHMPSVDFLCGDPSLSSVAIRVYSPFSVDPESSGHVEFR